MQSDHSQPRLQSLAHRGYIQGLTLYDSSQPQCHYFGGVRYALPPAQRFRQAQRLPESYSYGTKEQPGQCNGRAGVCPQPSFRSLSLEEGWSEDCFQCNIWVPLGEPPRGGWPVLFFIHGGWLQFGTPNTFSAAALLSDAHFDAIIVMPAYRLNVFGFLYSSELEREARQAGERPGNQGFWDQRIALEWTRDHVSLFGGDPGRISVAGYSAGANSTFYQLAHDLSLPRSSAIIKNAIIWSNSPTTRPKAPSTAQEQFNAVLNALHIPVSLPGDEKLARLREVPSSKLLAAATSTAPLLNPFHQFRPVDDSHFTLSSTPTNKGQEEGTEGSFIPPHLFPSLYNGTFASTLLSRRIHLLTGECASEHHLYGTWYPPAQNSLSAVRSRLLAEYHPLVVDKILRIYYPDGKLPGDCRDWYAAFGRIYADIQVHVSQRGMLDGFLKVPQNKNKKGEVEEFIHRYRLEYRLPCAAKTIPAEWGVTHATDMYIWFWGNGEALADSEKRIVWDAVVGPFRALVHGDTGSMGWGAKGVREMRVLGADGRVEVRRDGEMWERAVAVWEGLRGVQVGDNHHDGHGSRL